MSEPAGKASIRFDLLIRDGQLFLLQQPARLETGPYENVFEALKVCRERRTPSKPPSAGRRNDGCAR